MSFSGALLSREDERKRAEDLADWPFHIPREIMDTILASPDLGVREHLALAATCCAFRRMYHSNQVWTEIRRHRTVPVDGRQRRLSSSGGLYKDDRMLQHLATRPQKRKANGPFMQPLAEAYGGHYDAIQGVRRHRIPKAKVNELYPTLTDAHLKRLKYYPENKNGYPNQHTKEGYAEGVVEWLSIRVRNGWDTTGPSDALTGEASAPSGGDDTQEGPAIRAKKRPADSDELKDGDKGKKARR